jgi:hypothetical protein
MKAFRKVNSQGEFHQSFKSQSAMEYLMTYGWAILIIAVVLAALFELGVFNPMTFAPKASPGSCQVVRPEGAGTTNFISLEGECNGELPQYVASFNGAAWINISYMLPTTEPEITITAWVKKKPDNMGTIIRSYGSVGLDFSNGPTIVRLFVNQQWNLASPDFNDNGAWYFIAGTYNGTYSTQYSDGLKLGYEAYANTINSADNYGRNVFQVGAGPYVSGIPYVGDISNIQIYNTSLSANDIQAIYQEGIGGAPIKIQSLIGWWPLNGNANDYSGNGNDGVPSGITYTGSWYSGYSTP